MSQMMETIEDKEVKTFLHSLEPTDSFVEMQQEKDNQLQDTTKEVNKILTETVNPMNYKLYSFNVLNWLGYQKRLLSHYDDEFVNITKVETSKWNIDFDFEQAFNNLVKNRTNVSVIESQALNILEKAFRRLKLFTDIMFSFIGSKRMLVELVNTYATTTQKEENESEELSESESLEDYTPSIQHFTAVKHGQIGETIKKLAKEGKKQEEIAQIVYGDKSQVRKVQYYLSTLKVNKSENPVENQLKI